MEYKVKINDFEGPLDLLLHLIKKMKIDIWDISIMEITESYLSYIRDMEEMNLDIASEYLVMAAELIELKSRLLLPRETIEDDEEYEEDPKEALIRRLIEYKQYKEVTNKFKDLEESRQLYVTKETNDINKYSVHEDMKIKEEVGVTDLLEAFQKFLQRKEYEKPITTKVTKREITINERRIGIRKILVSKKRISFDELFEELTKSYVITTFLAVLEMSKNNEIVIKQERNFKNIFLELREGETNE
jgi:segregation and condensation protein A